MITNSAHLLLFKGQFYCLVQNGLLWHKTHFLYQLINQKEIDLKNTAYDKHISPTLLLLMLSKLLYAQINHEIHKSKIK